MCTFVVLLCVASVLKIRHYFVPPTQIKYHHFLVVKFAKKIIYSQKYYILVLKNRILYLKTCWTK